MAIASFGADTLVGSLLPENACCSLLPIWIWRAGRNILGTAQRSGSIEDEAAVARDLEAAGPALLLWFLASGAQIEPSLTYASTGLNAEASGELPIDGSAAMGISGGLTLTIEDFAGFQQRVAAAMRSNDPCGSADCQLPSTAFCSSPQALGVKTQTAIWFLS